MLAGLLKGPNYYNPDRHPDRAKERLGYVLQRMQEDGTISTAQNDEALAAAPKLATYQRPRRDSWLSFHRFSWPRGESGRRRQPDRALLHGALHNRRPIAARYRSGAAGRSRAIRIINRADAVPRTGSEHRRRRPQARCRQSERACRLAAWQQALQAARLPLYDVHWTPAVVVSKGGGKKGDDAIRVGLPDGRILPLAVWSGAIRRGLSLYDVVYVHVVEGRSVESKSKGKSSGTSCRRPRRHSCACGRRCKARRLCSKTRAAESSPWPAAFLIR